MPFDFMDFLRTRFIVAVVLGVLTEFLMVWVVGFGGETNKISQAIDGMSMGSTLVFVAIFFVVLFVAEKLYGLIAGRKAETATEPEETASPTTATPSEAVDAAPPSAETRRE